MNRDGFHPSLFSVLLWVVCLFLFPLFSSFSLAASYHVYSGGSIQTAIDGANPSGDEIIVHPGTYSENIDFGGKDVNLHSEDPTNSGIVASTIIDGGGVNSVVTFDGSETGACILSGFTITNGYASDGGGIYGSYGVTGTMATIQHNMITTNTASSDGGGLYNCDGLIQLNTIVNNRSIASTAPNAWAGGLDDCDGTIQNNIIANNTSQNCGGGLGNCNGIIQNNTIWGNSAYWYGGGLDSCSPSTFRNNIIYQNTASSYPQLNACSTPYYSCIQGLTMPDPNGNINDDPQLADPANGDFHLLGSSPCIDAGTDASPLSEDFEGDYRPIDGLGDGPTVPSEYDMGADEYHMPCPIEVPADFATIQGAINAASHGCEIIVSPNTYTENISFNGKNIILRSTDPSDPSVVESTVIDGGGSLLASVVTFSGSELSGCTLTGFTITNGNFDFGSGILGNGTLATIEYNMITTNTAGYSGGGLSGCDGTIQYNTISGNSAFFDGGGLYGCHGTIQHNTISGNLSNFGGGGLNDCNGTIQSNTISGNWAGVYGGGLWDCDGIIQNNTISNNSSDAGGGMVGCDVTIQNNAISGNSASSYGGGLYQCQGSILNNTIYDNSAGTGGGGLYDNTATIRNCIIWQNTAPSAAQLDTSSIPTYSCIQGGSPGTGNITDDPLLVDPSGGDFHLSADSPCIDAGGTVTLTQDFEGDLRPRVGVREARGDNSDFDIGADEYYVPYTPVCDTFEADLDIWTCPPMAPTALHVDHWANALEQTDAHAVGLEDPDNTTNYFGFWDAYIDADNPVIGWEDDKVLVAFFQLSGTVSGSEPLPSMRLRLFTNHNKYNSYVRIYPSSWITVPAHGQPTSDPLSVPVVLHPPASLTNENGFALAFDIVDFAGDPRGDPDGTAWLDQVCVYSFDLPTVDAGFSSVRSYSATDLGSQWSQMSSAAPGYSLPTFNSDTGGLHITTVAADTMVFGAWTVNPGEQASYTNGDLHRVLFKVQASSVLAPQLRLRTHSQDYVYASYAEIVPGSGDGAAMPTTATDVPVYFWPPGTVSGTPEIVMAFDGIDIEPVPFLGGTLNLQSVEVEQMTGLLEP